jgi:hypothetical protein
MENFSRVWAVIIMAALPLLADAATFGIVDVDDNAPLSLLINGAPARFDPGSGNGVTSPATITIDQFSVIRNFSIANLLVDFGPAPNGQLIIERMHFTYIPDQGNNSLNFSTQQTLFEREAPGDPANPNIFSDYFVLWAETGAFTTFHVDFISTDFVITAQPGSDLPPLSLLLPFLDRPPTSHRSQVL